MTDNYQPLPEEEPSETNVIPAQSQEPQSADPHPAADHTSVPEDYHW